MTKRAIGRTRISTFRTRASCVWRVLALALWCLGFPNRAVAASSEAIAYARRLAHPSVRRSR